MSPQAGISSSIFPHVKSRIALDDFGLGRHCAWGILWAAIYGLGAYGFGAALLAFAIIVIVWAVLYVRGHEAELQRQAERALPGPLQSSC
jgi:hypothetical protein